MNFNRRTFLKGIALTTAGSLLPGCEREVHRLVPYLLPDDEIVPGVANWYASVCRECDAGCGIIVRVMEGRAKKIEGNPSHPLNGGKLCARGQAGLQNLYNPDRLRSPLRREGPRGEGRFTAITWEEGMSLWVKHLRDNRKHVAMISAPISGTLAEVVAGFLERIAGRLLLYDPSGQAAVSRANRHTFGLDHLPFYDLANADYLLSFGAPFLEHWLSPVFFGRAFGHFRQGRPGVRGRFIQVEPRLSLTAASADRWIPVRPGTEGLVALGIALVMLREGWTRGDIHRRKLVPWLNAYRVEDIAAASDVAQDDLTTMAREFSHAAAPLAIGGGMASAHTNGSQTLAAINALNLLAGNLDKPGGLRVAEPPAFPTTTASPPSATERDLVELAAQFKAGRYTVLQLYRSNPLFTVPASTGIRTMFEQAPFIVSFSSFLDESTAMADLILPDHSPLESWGDSPQIGLIPEQAVGLAQPVVDPLYDTRSVGDVFLHAAHQLDEHGDHALPGVEFVDLLRSNWKTFLGKGATADGSEAAWVRALQAGGSWTTPAKRASFPRQDLGPPYRSAGFAGDANEYPFYFYPFPSLSLSRGEGANLPWLQELPDTLTTAVWGSWVELNPATADRLGLKSGELVRVTSPHGHVEAPLVVSPGIRPDLVAVPMGQGHDVYGRYAARRGVNPVAILAPMFDEDSGVLAAAATRVRIEGTGKPGKLVLMEQIQDGRDAELLTIRKIRKA